MPPAQLSDLEDYFWRILQVALAAVGLVLFFMLISGGFKLLTSEGDPGKAQAAWKTITFAIIGAVVIVASYLIIRFIKEFTGVDVGNFKVTIP